MPPSIPNRRHALAFGRIPRDFARYGLSGLLGTGAHYLVMGSTIGIASPTAASTGGAIVGCLVNFLLARQFVFRSRRSVPLTFARFCLVAGLGVLVNAIVLSVLIKTLPILPSQLTATFAVLTLGFTLNRFWTFDE